MSVSCTSCSLIKVELLSKLENVRLLLFREELVRVHVCSLQEVASKEKLVIILLTLSTGEIDILDAHTIEII
jgi:hypothetical protein